MENNNVPFVVYEAAQNRSERINRRLIKALVIAIVLILVTNAIWLYAWMQYDYTGEDFEIVSVDGKDGVANYIGQNGSITNGTNNSDNDPETKAD